MRSWQVHEAKNRLSELLEVVQEDGPQLITRHDSGRAVLLSLTSFQELASSRKDPIAHLLGGPKVDDFTVERNQDPGRDVEL